MPLCTFIPGTGLQATSNTVLLSPYMLSISSTKRSETAMRRNTATQ